MPLNAKTLKEEQIRCYNCNAPLANIIIIESNEERINKGCDPLSNKFIISNCYRCKEFNKINKVFSGTIRICQPKDFLDLSIDSTEILNDDTIVNTISLNTK